MRIAARTCVGTALAISSGVLTPPPAIVDVMMASFGREYEVTSIVRRVAAAADLAAAVRILEDSVPGLVRSSQVTCAREAGDRAHLMGLIVEPIGDTGIALVARRPPLVDDFGSIEIATLSVLASAIAPAFARLLEAFQS